ncbi:MAG: (4Fe-4S)-binding protein [Gemmatimonadota bacterium]|nr:(4Fe-4S)-binding protein [Gemmatimonadota bacterium]
MGHTPPDQTPLPGDQHDADAGSGGAGAPPESHESNRVYTDLTREYVSDEIRVQWYASRCIHSAACIRSLPEVFDPRRRPWINLSTANADAIANAVLTCPTGALHFERPGGRPSRFPKWSGF